MQTLSLYEYLCLIVAWSKKVGIYHIKSVMSCEALLYIIIDLIDDYYYDARTVSWVELLLTWLNIIIVMAMQGLGLVLFKNLLLLLFILIPVLGNRLVLLVSNMTFYYHDAMRWCVSWSTKILGDLISYIPWLSWLYSMLLSWLSGYMLSYVIHINGTSTIEKNDFCIKIRHL